jgi:predicted Zn-dependent protease
VKKLAHPDSLYLQAAYGWLELGNHAEASVELDNLSPELQNHPEVLQVRVLICCAAQKWGYAAELAGTLCTLMPDSSFGPVHLARALRKQERTAEARQVLFAIAHKFPKEWCIHYGLACYDCRLGQRNHSLRWLRMAIDLAGKETIRAKALAESDLESLWPEIAGI